MLTADNGSDARAVFTRDGGSIDPVVSDMVMPVMDGPALMHARRGINPAVRIIATSGLAADGRVVGGDGPARHFLPKPYTAETLRCTVRDALYAPLPVS